MIDSYMKLFKQKQFISINKEPCYLKYFTKRILNWWCDSGPQDITVNLIMMYENIVSSDSCLTTLPDTPDEDNVGRNFGI